MKIFWAPQTRSTQVIWMLEEAGVDYEMELIDIRSADREDSKEFLAASPMGKVPAIVDGDVAMSESESAMSEKFSDLEPNRGRNGWGDFDSMIKVFDECLEGKEWILGDRFTAADVMLGSSAVFMRMFEMLPETKNIGDYANRCLARPAFQKASEIASG